MKLKTKHITRVLLVAVLLFLCMPVLVNAQVHSYDSASVTTIDSNPYSKVAITPESSMFASLQISGNKPGTFALQNWQGGTIDSTSVPDVMGAELYFPVTIGTNINYQNGYGLSPEWNTRFVNVANNSNKFGEYDVSLVTDRYKIGTGDSIEVQMNTGIIPEVDINVQRSGIYQIWYNDVGLGLNIVSPSGKNVIAIQTQLPDHQFGGSTLGRYFYFAAFEIGKYKMTFTTGASVVNFRCEYFNSKTIRSGTTITDGVLPGSSEILNPEYKKYVYEMSVDLLNYYVYSTNFDFNDPGAANRRIFYQSASQSNSATLATGDDLIYSPHGGSKVYIVIDVPDYFTWASPGVAESNVPRFSLEFNEIKSDRVNFGDSEMIVVSQQEFAVSRFVRTRKPGVFSFQFESVGPSSPNLIHGVPYIRQITDDQVMNPQIYEPVYSTGGNYSVNVLLSKGTYKFGFSHSGYPGNEYMLLSTAFTEAGDTSVVVKDPVIDLTSGQFTDVRLSGWEGMSDPDGATHGGALLWDIGEDFRHYGYNVTFDPAKNLQIFDMNLVPDLEFLFDQDTPTFVDYTGAGSLPLKTSGATVGDAFVIGAYDRYTGVDVSLTTASDTDAFVWEYLSGGTWAPFTPSHDFMDGTWVNGSGSLQQSGYVSWDPEALISWNYADTTTNNTGTGVPDTSDRELYLVRVYCNTSAATIPTVSNFSLKKYADIQFDLNLELGFDTGPLGDPYYDDTSGEAEWAGGVSVNSASDPISLQDTGFGLNYNFNYETALLFLSTKDMEIRNFNGSNTGVLEELTADMVFSVSIFRQDLWVQQEYQIGTDAPAVHSADVNYSTQVFGHTLAYNGSSTPLAYVKLLPARNGQFDWTQITMMVRNGTVGDVYYYMPWSQDGYNIRADGTYDYTYTGSAENHSMEVGFVTEYILMEFDISATESDGMIYVDLYAGHFGYPQISFRVSGFAWTWYYTVAVVGVVAIAGGVVAFFLIRKKKRGY